MTRTAANPSLDEWLDIRRQEAQRIELQTAKVWACYARTMDPYGVYKDTDPDYHHISLELFARAPNSDIWVSFQDLSQALCRALEKKCRFYPEFMELSDLDQLPF